MSQAGLTMGISFRHADLFGKPADPASVPAKTARRRERKAQRAKEKNQ